MEIPVYYQQKHVGQATIAAEGLYTRVSVTARGLPEKILRAWALTEDSGVLPLGVLVPEGEAWTTSRKFPAAAVPETIRICEISSDMPEIKPSAQRESPAEGEPQTGGEAGSEPPQWQPFDGAALHCRTPGARCRPTDRGLEVALPYDPEIPCELVPLFCFFTIAEEDGQLWLRLYLDEHGEPVLPAPADT